MRCWTTAEIAQQEADENMDVPPPAPSVAFPPFPPVSLPTFPVPMPTFPVPVPMPTFPTNGIDPNNCAREGGRAQQCGASPNRAPMCCEGFVCTPGNSKVSHRSVHRYCGGINRVNNATSLLGCPSDLYACFFTPTITQVTCTSAAVAEAIEAEQLEAQTCAGNGGRAMECGAAAGRPPVCCPGHVCVEGAGVKCVALAPPTPPPVFGPTLQPTERPTRDPSFCGAVDERAIACGSNNLDHPDKCCPGLICRFNQGGINRPICVEPPAGYVFPTPFPTPLPTPAPTTPQPTPFPTTFPPTMEFPLGTPEPTDDSESSPPVPGEPADGLPTNSAMGLAASYGTIAVGTVGVVLAVLLM